MRRRVRTLLSLSLFTLACGDSSTELDQGFCAADEAALLVPVPASWDPEGMASHVSLQVVGDRLLYGFGDSTRWGQRDLVDLCGGESELVLSAGTLYGYTYVVESPVGPVLYSSTGSDMLVAIDRLDVPGRDEARPILGSWPSGPEGGVHSTTFVYTEVGRIYGFGVRSPAPGGSGERTYGVAGLGEFAPNYYHHSGDPDDPVTPLGDEIVRIRTIEGRSFLLGQDGRVHTYDASTGELSHVLDDARYFDVVWGPGHRLNLLYQALGDDQSEPVRVRELETGDEREVTVNDFAALSWGRNELSAPAGVWLFSGADDGVALALQGPEGALVEAYALDTLEAFDIPEHVSASQVAGEQASFLLGLPDPADTVLALWEPQTGALVEVYRGPEPEGMKAATREGDRVLYTLKNDDGSLRRISVDLKTGESTTDIPRLGAFSLPIADGRLLSVHDLGAGESELALVDPETGDYAPLVERTRSWAFSPDKGVVYLDLEAPEPGIWTRRFPAR